MSASVGQVDISNSQTTRFELLLPKKTELKVGMRKESWGDAVVKIFKKEIQTGDAEFDKLVYISTDTPEATAGFLKADDVRAAVGLLIETGGVLEIDGDRVTAEAVGHIQEREGDDITLVKIVAALLA
jgi:hypothetical protein